MTLLDSVHSLRLACRAFRLSLDNSYGRLSPYVQRRPTESQVDGLTGLARRCSRLKSLSFGALAGDWLDSLTPFLQACAESEVEEVIAYDCQVSSLAPLAPLAPSLHRLVLCDSAKVEDLAPLSGLHQLKVLDISGTRVSDLSPLSTLTSLVELDISRCPVTDLADLHALRSLSSLDASNTGTDSLDVVRHLPSLTHLNIRGTCVTDLQPLSLARASLTYLDFSYTRVADLASLAGHTALRTLWAAHTAVTSIAALGGMVELVMLYLEHTGVTDLTPLAGCCALQSLVVGPGVVHLAPLARCGNLERLVVCGSSVNVTPLVRWVLKAAACSECSSHHIIMLRCPQVPEVGRGGRAKHRQQMMPSYLDLLM